jgi:hypothetical protein
MTKMIENVKVVSVTAPTTTTTSFTTLFYGAIIFINTFDFVLFSSIGLDCSTSLRLKPSLQRQIDNKAATNAAKRPPLLKLEKQGISLPLSL